MARKKTQDEKDNDLLLANMRELLKHRFGKDFVWFVLSECNLYGESFTGNSTTFYNEGKRAVGLSILQLLEDTDPEAYARLLIEKQQRGVRNGSRSDSGDTDT